ncbi:hypothetical protein M9Y10_015961 [Tritrichomonas musculus]|uniref:Protein NO VEIN C-terminal domain-containing protein n=1 Tax=Tritrichomonas musculus TaxID=1915356 RepID=A0ABR2I596_9EUKA
MLSYQFYNMIPKSNTAKGIRKRDNSLDDYISQFDSMLNTLSTGSENLKEIEKQNSIILNKLDMIELLIKKLLPTNEILPSTNKQKKKKLNKSERNKTTKKKQNTKANRKVTIIQTNTDSSALSSSSDEEDSKNNNLTTKKSRKVQNRENDPGFLIGYHGEGLTYEDIAKMQCFTKIEWNGLSQNRNLASITLNNGNQYFIEEDGEHYDLYAEDSKKDKYYFEVKSTNESTRGKSISPAQKKFMHKLNHKTSHFILAVITKVFSAPVINYFLFIPGFNFLPIEIDRNAEQVNWRKIVKEMKENKKYASAVAASSLKEKNAVKAKAKISIGRKNMTKTIAN